MDAVSATTVKQVAHHFDAFRALAGFGAIRSEVEYGRATAMLAAVLDALRNDPSREDEAHPLAAFLDYLTAAVRDYEAAHHALPAVPPRDVVRFLMEQHGLSQGEVPEIGNQSVVSQILSGRRLLNARQIAALVARFGIAADALLDLAPAQTH